MSQSIDWQVEVLRIVGFAWPEGDNDVSTLWADVIGEEPDYRQVREGEVDVRGIKHANGMLFLGIYPDRVEWLYGSERKFKEDSAYTGFPIIGGLDEELRVITDIGERWLRSSKMIRLRRMLFGGTLLKPADSLNAAYQYMQELSPFLDMKALNNPYDFEYQILRELDCETLDDQIINRQCKWEVVRLRRSGQLLAPRQQQIALEQSGFATQLKLALRTEEKKTVALPQSKLPDLIAELVSLARDVSEKGDLVD